MPKGNGKPQARLKSKTPAKTAPLVVGIGASAGGLQAFKAFFGHMPADSGMAFVLIQHLDPDHQSMLAELIGSHTDMTVKEAADGERAEANQIAIIPPDATMTINRGRLHIKKPAPQRLHRRPIDTFFESLAADQGENAVCIILSGAGSDGTLGLRKIKEYGGFAMAQEGLDSQAVGGMPASAAATGLVDYTVPVEAMPDKLVAYRSHMRQVVTHKDADGNRRDAGEYLTPIVKLLHDRVGHDFSGYKEKTLIRRIQRRMQVLQIDAMPDYMERLRQDSGEVYLLFNDMLIGVTQFFRDPKAWERLEEKIIPKLFEQKSAASELRVWVAGCGTGEEVYSIAILLQEAMARFDVNPTVQVFGTDLDAHAIEVARVGYYPKALPGLTPERRKRYFTEDGESGDYRPNNATRQMCVFAVHSVIKDPPFSRLDLVSCRNLLIYLDNDLQDRVARKFHYALKPGGYLFLGASEGLSRNAALFETVDKKHRLFQRLESAYTVLPDVGEPEYMDASAKPAPTGPGAAPAGGDRIDRSVHRALARHAVPYVVVDARRNIVRFSGGAVGRYLEPSAGAASFELFGMLKKTLRPAVRAAVKNVAATGKASVQENLPVRLAGEARSLTLIVEPLEDTGNAPMLVAFQDTGAAPPAQARDEGGDTVTALEHELRVTKAQLNSAISELETANEEMRSANEEYQSVNEELQSSNEELETSKEEMQSVNEELQTVNTELTNKNEQLSKASSDWRNLLEATQIATLFLDSDLAIKSYTPSVRDLFHLRDGDLGRPITDIVTRLDYRPLKRDVEAVLRKLTLVEREVEIADGERQTFIMRIRPYRSVNDVIEGVVVTFTDITERKAREVEWARFAEIVNASKDAIVGHAPDGTITTWNPAARRIFGHTEEAAVGQPMTLLFPDERASEVSDILARLQRGEHVTGYEVTWQGGGDGRTGIEFTFSPVRHGDGAVVAISAIARDISERLAQASHRETLMHELSHRVKNTLASVRSIMEQTARNTDNLADFQAVFAGRVQALSNTHNLLTQGSWRGVDLRRLLEAELAPYGHEGEPNWALTGETVTVASGQAVALGMAFHELATNAVKHGPLSRQDGRVDIGWKTEAGDGRATLALKWKETGGLRIEKQPRRKGYGLRMIQEGLAFELDADVTLDFPADGLHCTVKLPLEPAGHGKTDLEAS